VLPALVFAVGPCDAATYPDQCGFFDALSLPPYVQDAILAKGGVIGTGSVLVLTSGLPGDADNVISNSMGNPGCGLNPDGFATYDCTFLNNFTPAQDSVALALSSEWPEYYQTTFTDWMTIAGPGISPVDISINSWNSSSVSIIPYGPSETGVIVLTGLSNAKTVDLRAADSGDAIYDTAILIAPATWFGNATNQTLLCGNGAIDPGEECDDGNTDSNDSCDALCFLPPDDGDDGNPVPFFPAAAVPAAVALVTGLAAYGLVKKD